MYFSFGTGTNLRAGVLQKLKTCIASQSIKIAANDKLWYAFQIVATICGLLGTQATVTATVIVSTNAMRQIEIHLKILP